MTCSHPFGDFRYNSTCDFVCPEGFERRGAGTLQCLASRQWSAETPTCAAVACPELAAPKSGQVNCSHPHGASAFSSTCDFSCQEGFEVTGPERLWCTAGGAWSGAPPHCKGRAGVCLEGDILQGKGLCVGRLQSFVLGLQSGSAGDKQGSGSAGDKQGFGRAASAPTKSPVWSKNPCTTYGTSMSQEVRLAVWSQAGKGRSKTPP